MEILDIKQDTQGTRILTIGGTKFITEDWMQKENKIENIKIKNQQNE